MSSPPSPAPVRTYRGFTPLSGPWQLISTVSRSCVANAAAQILCDQLSLCFRRRHLGRKSPHLVGKLRSAFGRQNITHCEPSAFDVLSRLKKSDLALLDLAVSRE